MFDRKTLQKYLSIATEKNICHGVSFPVKLKGLQFYEKRDSITGAFL